MSDHHHEHASLPIVLYATAEATNASYLHDATGYQVVTSARELSAVEHEQFIVVPMCTGRDLTSITQAAQALRWLNEQAGAAEPVSTGADAKQPRAVLAAPAFNHTYTIARLRHHLRQLSATHDAVLFVAGTVDPFADAELFRRVRLAQQFSENVEVAIAFDDPGNRGGDCWPTPEQALARLEALHQLQIVRSHGPHNENLGPCARTICGTQGKMRIAVVRADVNAPEHLSISTNEDGAAAIPVKALMPHTALLAAVGASAHNAIHALEHGDDGIAAGLMADHEQGFAHSHGHSHPHTHPHSH